MDRLPAEQTKLLITFLEVLLKVKASMKKEIGSCFGSYREECFPFTKQAIACAICGELYNNDSDDWIRPSLQKLREG